MAETGIRPLNIPIPSFTTVGRPERQAKARTGVKENRDAVRRRAAELKRLNNLTIARQQNDNADEGLPPIADQPPETGAFEFEPTFSFGGERYDLPAENITDIQASNTTGRYKSKRN